jgi:flavin reductase (DIM6/NTAB) family NADH-FMN oxidoreductase RutF
MKDGVHATIYYGHPRDIPELDEAWREWFPEDPPARTVPIVAGALATLTCVPHERLEAVDHTLLTGEVTGCRVSEKEPILYFRREFHRLARPAT